MTRKKRPPARPPVEAARLAPTVALAEPARNGRLVLGFAVLALLTAATLAYVFLSGNGTPAASGPVTTAPALPVAKADYVGSAACAACHAGEAKDWQGSQHAKAMQHASEQTVLGDFADARFTQAGVTRRCSAISPMPASPRPG